MSTIAIRHFFRMYRRVFANSTSTMLAYRSNLVFFFIFETMFLAGNFTSIAVGFHFAGGDIAGWTREQAFLMAAINSIGHQVFICFFIGPLFGAPYKIWDGTMDYVFLKPMPRFLSIMLNAGEITVSNLPNLAITTALSVWLFVRSWADFSAGALVACLVFLVVGIMVRVALAIFCLAPGFLAERLVGGEDVFWSLSSAGRYPASVYGVWLERFFTFGLPLAMLGSVQASVLFGKKAPLTHGLALMSSLLFVGLAAWFFHFAASRYKSVNSGV